MKATTRGTTKLIDLGLQESQENGLSYKVPMFWEFLSRGDSEVPFLSSLAPLILVFLWPATSHTTRLGRPGASPADRGRRGGAGGLLWQFAC